MNPENETIHEEPEVTPEQATTELEERKMLEQNNERVEKMIQQVMTEGRMNRRNAIRFLTKMHKKQMAKLNKIVKKNAGIQKQHVELEEGELIQHQAVINPTVTVTPTVTITPTNFK
jgi:UDP-3-O-[3-hydroxymyristoyl] glucosamine N-acyltransferase